MVSSFDLTYRIIVDFLVLCVGLALVRSKHCVSTRDSLFVLELLLKLNLKTGLRRDAMLASNQYQANAQNQKTNNYSIG
jgi:hypothetical protein